MVAFSDVGEVLNFCGTDVRLKAASDIPEAVRRVLASIKVKRYVEGTGDAARDVEVIEFKFLDKLQALVKLGLHLGLFTTPATRSDLDGDKIPIKVAKIVPQVAKEQGGES